jgi:hypothetical protein
MGARRFASLIVAWLCLVAGCVLFWSAVAQATEVHVFAGSFGSEGSGPGQFNGPDGLAVNDATHDVYVVDRHNDRVQELNSTGSTVIGEFNGSSAPTGAFSEPTQIAIDNSTNPLDPSKEDVYVVDRGHGVIDKFNASGAYEGQLTGTPKGPFKPGERNGITGVAVDPSGLVWVGVAEEGPIYSFNDALANHFLSEVPAEFGGTAENLGVDAEDNLYFYLGGGAVAQVNSAGGTVSAPFGGDREAFRLAVDPTGREVYLDNESAIEAFSLDGARIESFGSGHIAGPLSPISSGVAVDGSNGTVYVTDSEDRVLIFDAVHLPTVSIGVVTEQESRSLTLNGTVDPEGLPVTSCVFEYGPTSAYGQSAPCSPANPGAGPSPVAVSVHLTGLTPEISYHYRLVAGNVGGNSPSPDQELFTGPILGGEFVTDVASGSATLQGQIDPNNADTHYYFQYGTTASYGIDVPVAPPGVDIGSVKGVQSVSLHLQNLQPSTVYHYSVVAVQNGETFEEPDHTFTTQSAGGNELTLLDGRAWELVSPPNKNSAWIEAHYMLQAASDGSGITYNSTEAIGEDVKGKVLSGSQILSTRVPSGWRSQDISLPHGLASESEAASSMFASDGYSLFSSNLASAMVEPGGVIASLSPEATERTVYLRYNASGTYVPLVTPADVPPGTKFGGANAIGEGAETSHVKLVTATPDLNHIILSSPFALTPEAFVELGCPPPYEIKVQWGGFCGEYLKQNLYEWSAGRLQLVDILPDGEPAKGPVQVGVPNAAAQDSPVAHSAMSDDGRWVVWHVGPSETVHLGETVHLYVRDMVEGRTFQLGGVGARFETMSSDGSRVFFLEDGELYEFDTSSGTQVDLTGNHSVGESSAGVQDAVLGASEDGSYLYFVAKGVLASGGVSGADNLYVLHDASPGWTIMHVAMLSSQDEPDWYAQGESTGNTKEQNVSNPQKVTSRVSPNGRYVAFMSDSSLTGYDNVDAVSGQRDEEVFLYDVVAGRLVCASCDPTGARPVGLSDNPEGGSTSRYADEFNAWDGHWIAGNIPAWYGGGVDKGEHQPRFLSDGGRLFFDSSDSLVPQDTNGLEDVYEYEPVGIGSCTNGSATFGERAQGCVDLISSGTSSAESTFFDASENGSDVFFATTARLTAADYDTTYDIYDAHVCSSEVPCVVVPVSPPACSSGDSCKAAPSPQPEIFGPTPSATFSGVGNITEPTPKPAVRARPSTRSQLLARALTMCRRKRARKARVVCERDARGRYGARQAHRAKATRKGEK